MGAALSTALRVTSHTHTGLVVSAGQQRLYLPFTFFMTPFYCSSQDTEAESDSKWEYASSASPTHTHTHPSRSPCTEPFKFICWVFPECKWTHTMKIPASHYRPKAAAAQPSKAALNNWTSSLPLGSPNCPIFKWSEHESFLYLFCASPHQLLFVCFFFPEKWAILITDESVLVPVFTQHSNITPFPATIITFM